MSTHNIREFSAFLNDIGNTAVPRLAVATQKTVTDTTNTARQLAPVDTGYLRSSITGDTEVGGQTVRGEVTAGANYAIYVEKGTSRMAAQPFMRPAQQQHEPAWLAALAQLGGTQV